MRTLPQLALMIACIFLAACAPKMKYKVAPGTELILPFGGTAQWMEVAGRVVDAEFTGKWGKIKIRAGSLYLARGQEWAEYPEIVRFYRIELRDDELLFDGKKIDPKRVLPDSELNDESAIKAPEPTAAAGAAQF